MTAQAYNALDGDSLGADKIIRATTMQSLNDNPTAIAQRGSGAPWNNGVGAIAVLASGSGNWTVPDGVYRIKVTAIGGGGGGEGNSTNGGSGGNTTFSTLTANGGTGGNSNNGGTGGTASGGDINVAGQSGINGGNNIGGGGGDSLIGMGAPLNILSTPNSASGYGSGGGGTFSTGGGTGGGGGGGGGTAIKIFTTTPGGTLAYSVGAAGTAGTAGSTAGTPGLIVIEY